MTTALIKSLNQTRGLYNSSYRYGVGLKASGASFFDVGPMGGSAQLSQLRDDSTNRRRYNAFHGWIYSAIHALAKKEAGQQVNLGIETKKEDGKKPGKTKRHIINRMTEFARSKAASEEIDVLYNHPFLKALEYPNPMQGRWQFVYSFIANLCLTRWAYLIADDVGEDGYQFYSVPTTWVKPISPLYAAHATSPRVVAPMDQGKFIAAQSKRNSKGEIELDWESDKKVIFEINLLKGQRALVPPTKHTAPKSLSGGRGVTNREAIFLLPRDTKFKVEKIIPATPKTAGAPIVVLSVVEESS